MSKLFLKKKTRYCIYYYYFKIRSCFKISVYNRRVLYDGYSCRLGRCICSNITCKLCSFCIK